MAAKGDWKFNHPCEKEVEKYLHSGNVYLTELDFGLTLANTPDKDMAPKLRKTIALMSTRKILEPEIFPALMAALKARL